MERLLEVLLERLKAAGLLVKGGRARTDSTRVLAAVRTLNRLELVTETLRAALEVLAVAVPVWLTDFAPQEWYDRYERKADAFRLPIGDGPRLDYALTIGRDGFALLAALHSTGAPAGARDLPALQVLRQIWVQHYTRQDDEIIWRKDKQLLPGRALPQTVGGPDRQVPHRPRRRGGRGTGGRPHRHRQPRGGRPPCTSIPRALLQPAFVIRPWWAGVPPDWQPRVQAKVGHELVRAAEAVDDGYVGAAGAVPGPVMVFGAAISPRR
ncbi:hypothetical protein [Streptomyces sp. NPDC005799]|uniref:hypothetical protein n=1 Tax=Streptomyces sp. NPDC005799 TaxID=3154678 RepID=UPI0033D0F966